MGTADGDWCLFVKQYFGDSAVNFSQLLCMLLLCSSDSADLHSHTDACLQYLPNKGVFLIIQLSAMGYGDSPYLL